jgi:hypothetical protein
LKRRCADLVIRRRRCKVMQGLNVSTHEESLTADCADENGFCLSSQSLNLSTTHLLQPGVFRIVILTVVRDHEASSAVIHFPDM